MENPFSWCGCSLIVTRTNVRMIKSIVTRKMCCFQVKDLECAVATKGEEIKTLERKLEDEVWRSVHLLYVRMNSKGKNN